MVVEIKQAVAVNFLYIDSHDALEMIIYCSYVMRLHKLNGVLGVYSCMIIYCYNLMS